MSRLFHTGFELGDLGMWDGPGSDSSNAVTTSHPRNGIYCFGTSTGKGDITKRIAPATTTLYARYGFYWQAGASGYISLLDDTGAFIARVGLSSTDNGFIHLYRGSSTSVFTSPLALTAATWHLIEWRLLLDPTMGAFELLIDGATQNVQTSLNTGPATPPTVLAIGTAGDVGGSFFDDFALNDSAGSINNTWIGDGACLVLTPTGVGDVTQLALGGSAPAAVNWASVDEIPPDDGVTYNMSSSSSFYDLYNLAQATSLVQSQTPALNVTSVNAVITYMRTQKDSSANAGVKLVQKINGVEYRSVSYPLTEPWTWISKLDEVSPSLGGLYDPDALPNAAWTLSILDELQVGVELE